MSFIQPPSLQKGDTIAITCPAGALSLEKAMPMKKAWEDEGYRVIVGETIGSNYFKFSANDDERCHELQRFLDDPSIQAIHFGRGGYGVVRIIDRLNFDAFVSNPKWLIGFSDITCLHSHVHTNYQICTLHAHMSGGFLPEEKNQVASESIFNVLEGGKIQYEIMPHPLNRTGSANGILTGGNLALLSDLIGTDSDIDTTGKILMIEDVSEYLYNIDRMMWQLKRAGKLTNLTALLVGGFTEVKDDEIPFGMNAHEIIREKVESYDYPVVFNFPSGHQPENLALKFGTKHQIDVHENKVKFFEQ
jgi:Uncharacterized proteins, homologs of microcin C7 resistance protein MccF